MAVIGKIRQSRGFSLVELTILLMVLGVIMTGFLARYRPDMKSKNFQTTQSRSEILRTAMERFLTSNGRFPCPADPTLPPDDPAGGKEQCIVAGGIRGLTGYQDADDLSDPIESTPQPVLFGMIPYTALGVSFKDALDGWGGTLAYAVSVPQTTTATYRENRGGIRLKIYDPGSNAEMDYMKNGIPANLDIVIFSYGDNRAGAYSIEGQLIEPCASGFLESVNCSASKIMAEFKNYDTKRSYNNLSPDYYDDVFLLSDVNIKVDKWSQQTASFNIYNSALSSGGRVGIGTNAPTEKLDVNGNMKVSNKVNALRFCKADGTRCFTARTIGGTGVNCGSGVMTGIRNNQASCVNKVNLTANSIVPGNCPAGEFIVGISPGGTILCEPP